MYKTDEFRYLIYFITICACAMHHTIINWSYVRYTENKVLKSVVLYLIIHEFTHFTISFLVDEKCIEVAHSVDMFSDSKSVPTVRISKTTRKRCNPMGKNRLLWYPSFISSLKKCLLYYYEIFRRIPVICLTKYFKYFCI